MVLGLDQALQPRAVASSGHQQRALEPVVVGMGALRPAAGP